MLNGSTSIVRSADRAIEMTGASADPVTRATHVLQGHGPETLQILKWAALTDSACRLAGVSETARNVPISYADSVSTGRLYLELAADTDIADFLERTAMKAVAEVRSVRSAFDAALAAAYNNRPGGTPVHPFVAASPQRYETPPCDFDNASTQGGTPNGGSPQPGAVASDEDQIGPALLDDTDMAGPPNAPTTPGLREALPSHCVDEEVDWLDPEF